MLVDQVLGRLVWIDHARVQADSLRGTEHGIAQQWAIGEPTRELANP